MEISTRHQPHAGDLMLWLVNSLHLPATVAGKYKLHAVSPGHF